jgi:cytochrome c peroxidase
LGRFEHTQVEEDKGRFKTPTLRNVTSTAPYMHDGSIQTLPEVIEFYNRGGQTNAYLSRTIQPLHLSPDEKADLLEFLKALDSSFSEAASVPEAISGLRYPDGSPEPP